MYVARNYFVMLSTNGHNYVFVDEIATEAEANQLVGYDEALAEWDLKDDSKVTN